MGPNRVFEWIDHLLSDLAPVLSDDLRSKLLVIRSKASAITEGSSSELKRLEKNVSRIVDSLESQIVRAYWAPYVHIRLKIQVAQNADLAEWWHRLLESDQSKRLDSPARRAAIQRMIDLLNQDPTQP